jgi:hypothetical protein
MAKSKLCNCGVKVFDRYSDLPQRIREFGLHIKSNINSPDRGLIEPSIPLNQLGDKMYGFDSESDIEYCVLISPPFFERTHELAHKIINQLSFSGEIYRYDLPDGTIFYISF